MKKLSLFLVITSLCALLCSCSGKGRTDVASAGLTLPDNSPSQSQSQNSALPSDNTYIFSQTPSSDAASNSTNAVSEPTTQADATVPSSQPTQPSTTQKSEAPTKPDDKNQPEKTGDMAFSDSTDNKYLAAVVEKYGVDAKLLVSIYTVPDADGNLVLQFDGSADENGRLIRTADKLVAIYTVDKALNCKRASKDRALDEYSFAETSVMYFSITTYVMPEFDEEL